MSFNPLMAKLVPEGPKSVVELGNQTFRANLGFSSTESYYKSKGYEVYKAIDVNSRYGSLMMDLNKDLRHDYGFVETFDLVTNNGTGEHLFNQYQVFKNIHQLCKVGGLMLHVMPFVNWLNHGFYNFHPLLYADLATANHYQIKYLKLGNRWGRTFDISDPSYLKEKKGKIWEAVKYVQEKGEKNVMIIALLGKTNNDPFKIPIQGKYAGDIEDETIRSNYAPA